MKNKLISFLKKREVIIHLCLMAMLVSMLNVEWTTGWFDKSTRPNILAPINVLFFFGFFYLNIIYLIPKFLTAKRWWLYFLIIGGIVILSESIRAGLFAWIVPISGHFGEDFILEFQDSKESLIFGAINISWFAFLLAIMYRFSRDWFLNKQRIQALENEKMAIELSLLKSQIDPHFLFNNLNALDDLINRDTEEAKAYLHKLSQMYRYSISNMKKNVVTLAEEWSFIEDYIYLIQKRFGAVYQFEKINNLDNLNTYLIPPAALQTLVENTVKHNQGSIEKPLIITIKVNEAGVSVSNTKRAKINKTESLGTGLANLRSRFQLLSNQEIHVEDSEQFVVTLPLIKQLP